VSPEKFGRPAGILLVLLLVNTAYIAAFASPTISCMGNGVLHLALGVTLAIVLLWLIRQMPLPGTLFFTLGMYPRDRVALNQAARILFLQRKYAEALKYLDRICDVDPEDLQMHYTRMLHLRGLDDAAGAGREQTLIQRFKAQESAQAITAKPRLLSPENNNERQQIHDHESVPLNVPASRPKRALVVAGGAQ
jgi:tetratricopeptide (TPR) repeat protein